MYWDKQFLRSAYANPELGKFYDRSKDEKYFLNVCKSIYAQSMNDSYGLYANREIFEKAKLYSTASQDISIYQDLLDPLQPQIDSYIDEKGNKQYRNNDSVLKRYGIGNINYEVYHILPKFIRNYVGKMTKAKTRIDIQSQDLMTKELKQKKKTKVWVNKLMINDPNYRELMKGTNELENMFVPSSAEELEIVYSGIKLEFETAMENAITNDMKQSDWDEIERKLYRSIFNYNRLACEITYDRYTNQTRVEYADVLDCGIQYSRYNDHRNSEWAYKFTPYTVAEFRAEHPDMEEEALWKLVNSYVGSETWKMIPNDFSLDSYSKYDEEGYCNYDNLMLPVIKVWWKTVDTIDRKVSESYYKKIKNPDNDKFIEVEINGKVRKSEIESGKIYKKEEGTDVEMVYNALWLIGSEHVWKNKKMDYQIRVGRKAMLPLVYYRLDGKSLNEACQRSVDNLVLAQLRYQDSIINAPKEGIEIDWNMAVAMSDKIDGFKPFDIITMRRKGTGDIFTIRNDIDPQSLMSKGVGGGGAATRVLEGGIGRSLQEYFQIFAHEVAQIQSLIGITGEGAADVPNVNTDMTAYQAQLRALATNDNLYESYSGMQTFKSRLATNMASRIQMMISYSKKCFDSYSKVIGVQGCKAIKELEDRDDSPAELGITIIAQPDEEEIKQIYRDIEIGLSSGKNGVALLTMGESFVLKDMIKNGTSLSEVRAVMLNFEDNRRRAEEAKAMKAQQQQNEGVMQQNQQKFEMDKQLIMAKAEAEIMVKKAEAEIKIREMYTETELEKQLRSLDARFDLILENAKARNNMSISNSNQMKPKSES